MSHDLVRQTTTTMAPPFVLAVEAGFAAFADRYAVGAPIFVGLQGLDAQGAPVAQRCVGVGQLLVDGRLQIDSVSAGSSGAALPAFSCASIVVVDVMSIAALDALATTRANAVVAARALERGLGDMWTQVVCMGVATLTSQEIGYAVLAGGTGLADTAPLAGDTIGQGSWTIRTNAGSNNSGVSYRSAAEAVVARGGLLVRTRAAIRSSASTARFNVASILDSAATTGFGFFFFGLDARARVGNGSVSQTSIFTLTIDKFYVFETEVDAGYTSATFRIYDGDTGVLLWSETIATNVPPAGTGLSVFAAQGIFTTSPGVITPTMTVSHMGFGTRRGFDVWRRGIA